MSPSVRKWPVALMLLALSPAFLRCARSTSANAVTAPSVTSVSPNEGPLAGGTTITITGSAFTLTSSVTVAGKTCSQVIPMSPTQISCETPSVTTTGAKDVVVTNRNFTSGDLASGTLTGGFTYLPLPTVTSSTQGFYMGGTTITITGTGFRTGATVTIGGATCTSPAVASSTSLTCVNPAGTALATGTIVVTDSAAGSGTLTNGFTWRLPQFNTFLDGNGTQGLAKDNTKDATRPRLVNAGSKLAAVWQEVIGGGTATQIRAISFDGTLSGATKSNWDFFDNDKTAGLNKDSTLNATAPYPAVLSTKLYIAWSEINATKKQIRVRVNTGTLAAENWTFVEKAVPDDKGINVDTAEDAEEATAFVFNSKLYVAWKEYNTTNTADEIRVKEYNGNDSAPSWTAIVPGGGLNENASRNASTPSLGTVSGKLYGIWSEADATPKTIIRAKVYSGSGTSWSTVYTSAGFGCNCNQATAQNTFTPMLLLYNSKLYATWIESNGTNNQARVAVYNGNDASPSWSCVDGGTLNKSSTNNSSNPRLGILGGTLFVTWSEGATGQTRIKAYNGNDSSPSWTPVDGDLSTGLNKDTSRAATFPDILGYGNYPYAMWTETDGVSTSIRVKYGN